MIGFNRYGYIRRVTFAILTMVKDAITPIAKEKGSIIL